METIETAIRNALDKGDASDPAYRQRVYRSATAAVEKAIQSNSTLAPDAADRRRNDVRDVIARVESEFVPAFDVGNEPPTVQNQPRYADAPPAAPAVAAERREPQMKVYLDPRIGAAEPPRERQEPAVEPLGGVERERISGSVVEDRRGGGGLARLLPVVVVLLLAAAGVWWALSSGFFDAPEQQAETAAPAQQEAGGTDAPLLPTDASRDWITVFSPSDPTQVSAPAGASAEVMEDDSGSFLRIRSGSGSEPIRFAVGQGILERIAGGAAVFDIVARSPEDTPTEIAVECDFGGLGDCGRKRYRVNYERGDFLFEVALPEGGVAGGGTIAIVPDVENAGKTIDIYEIRVSAGE